MSSLSLITSGVAWFAAAAVLAFLFSFHKALSGWIAGIGGAVGSLCTAGAGFTALTSAVTVSGVMPFTGHMLQITPLNAIWLITLGLCGLFVSLFNIDWHRHPQVKANGLLINLLMAAAVCAVVASNLGTMVVMAEIMALCAVFLTGGSKEGKLWFVLGRLGTLLLAIACWLVWQRYGTLDLGLLDQRAQQLPLGSDIWLLGVIGFGLLAGIIPLHGWVPQARQRQRSRRRAVLDRGDENRAAGHSHAISAWRQCAAVVGRGAVGAWDDHRLCRRSVRADGA